MRAVRKDYFLDHDHSVYVDQWDWERVIVPERAQPRLPEVDRSRDLARPPWRGGARPGRCSRSYAPIAIPDLPEEITFLHAEDILARYPDLPRKQRETRILQEYPAVFIIGIGWKLADGYPHEMRAADYDDWVTETVADDGRPMHGLNGDILVWNPVTRRRHELSSMGIRVNAETLRQQLEITGQLDWLTLPYHRGIVSGELPLSASAAGSASHGPRCCCSRRRIWARSASRVWPKVLKDMCAARDIHVIE